MELDLKDKKIWVNCPKDKYPWCKFMGLDPEYHDGFMRLNCIKTEDGYKTAGIQTKEMLGDGYVEVKARFHNGKSGWPAIWLFTCSDSKYYEIDICEHFSNKPWVKTGLFMYKHMHSWLKRLFRPKSHTLIDRDGWNIFGCEWNKDFIKVTINKKTVLTYKNDGNWESFPQTKEDRKFMLILSMQYEYGKPNPKQLPLWMDIEYVKYVES